MVTIMESIMLLCFGLSWPISVYKSFTSRSTGGKSPIFMVAILLGYLAGMAGKVMGGQISYVLGLYLLNFAFVGFDLWLWFRNRKLEAQSKRDSNV